MRDHWSRPARNRHSSSNRAVDSGFRSLRIAAASVWSIGGFAPLFACLHGLAASSTITQEGIFQQGGACHLWGCVRCAALRCAACGGTLSLAQDLQDQMLYGFGLAETTPGPLVIMLQFVGFMGAWKYPGSLAPLTAATLGSFLTSWVTFAPCSSVHSGGRALRGTADPCLNFLAVSLKRDIRCRGRRDGQLRASGLAWHAIFPGNQIASRAGFLRPGGQHRRIHCPSGGNSTSMYLR